MNEARAMHGSGAGDRWVGDEPAESSLRNPSAGDSPAGDSPAGDSPAGDSTAGAGLPSAGWMLGVGAILLAVVLWPVFQCRFFPSHNGPGLLSITHIAKHLDDPRFGYETHYVSRFYPVPYLAQHALQWVLLDVLPDREVPRWVTVMAIVFRFWSVWYWLGSWGAADRQRRWLCWLVLPWALEFILLRGYVNFHFGTSLVLVVYGWYLRNREHWTPTSLVIWNLLTLATYFCHAVPAALAGLLVGVEETVRSGRPMRVVGLAVRGFLPVLVLLVAFQLHSREVAGWGANEWLATPLFDKLRAVKDRCGTPLSGGVRWAGLLLLGLPGLLRLTESRSTETRGAVPGPPREERGQPASPPGGGRIGRAGWGVTAAWGAMSLVYLFCPSSLWGWHKADLHLLPLVPLLWLGVTPLPRRGWRRGVVPIVAAAVAVLGIGSVGRSLQAGSALVEEYLAGETAVPPRQPILSLMTDEPSGGSRQVFDPTQWADSYYLIRRGGGLGRSLVKYNTIYPVWFRDYREGGRTQFPEVDPVNPSSEELDRAAQVYGSAVLWGISEELTARLEAVGFERRLEQGRLRVLVNRRLVPD